MRTNLLWEVEDIHTRTFAKGARTIGVTSPQTKSDVSQLAKSLAKRCASSGQKSLLMKLSSALKEAGITDKTTLIGKTTSGEEIYRSPEGYDVLALNPEKSDEPRFHNARDLQDMLKSELEGYEQIIVDLSKGPETNKAPLPGGSSAAACDAVVLVCESHSVTRKALETAVESLAMNDAKIAGLVVNDQDAPTLGQEMLKEFSRMQWFLPKGIRDYIEKKSSNKKTERT